MKFVSPASLDELLSLLSTDPAMVIPVFSRLCSPRTTCIPVEILLEHEVEEGVDHNAGAMIIRRFSRFSSIISLSKAGRRSLLYAVPIIPQDVLFGVLPYTRPAPANQSLILGTDAFTTYHPTSRRIQNIKWKYLQCLRSATFSFTITSHCRDRDGTEPGVLTNKDMFVQRECSFLRIAVGRELATTKDWGIFRCFSYPDDPATSPAQEAGLLRIPLTLVSRPQNPRNQHFIPYIDSTLEREWAVIPNANMFSALLLFPLGYTSATVTHLVQHPAPPMFDAEVCAQRAREYAYQTRSQLKASPSTPSVLEDDQTSNEETIIETSSLLLQL